MGDRRGAITDLPPWQIAPYFFSPNVGSVSVTPTSAQNLFGPDPMRWFAIISAGAGPATNIGLTGTVTASQGILLQSSYPRLELPYSMYGPIVQLGWDAQVTGGGNVTITWMTLSLSRWPDEDVSMGPMADLLAPLPKRTYKIPDIQGVNGRGGLLGLWRRLTGRG